MFDLTALRARGRDERGATLVLMAVILIALLAIAGLVVNLGLVRSDRQRNKSAADVAVTAGLRALDAGNASIAPFRGACAALDYIKANHPALAPLNLGSGWSDGSDTPITGNPCDSSGASDPASAYSVYHNRACVTTAAAARDSFAWFQGTAGNTTVQVRAGYSASDMAADNFRDDAFHSDTGAPDKYGCDQLAVIVTERQDAGFGRVVGAGELSSRIRSVGRLIEDTHTEMVIALLLLEKHDCNVLTINGSNARVVVKGYESAPGIIHADSIGNGANCNNQILNSSVTTADGITGPGVIARQAEIGSPPAPGVITVAAKAGIYPGSDPLKDATACPSTVYPEPGPICVTGSDRKGRINVDVLYYDRAVNLLAQAQTRTSWTTTQALTNGFTVLDCAAATGTVTQRLVFVDCSNFNSSATFAADDAEVIFNGTVSVDQLRFTNPRSIFVKGPSSGGNGVSLTGNGTLNVNTGASATCEERFTANRSLSTKFVVVNGSVTVNGNNSSIARMCQTTMLMGAGGLTSTTPGKGADPYANSFNGAITMGGNGSFDWTAPNATDNQMKAGDPASAPFLDNFEDLAFWTETAGGNSLNGGGNNNIKGVFFLPNANPFQISGGAAQAIDRDAQFIIRKLTMGGNGILNMRPNPNNAISFPFFSGFALVR